jgi:hypothetical protein
MSEVDKVIEVLRKIENGWDCILKSNNIRKDEKIFESKECGELIKLTTYAFLDVRQH